MDDNRTNAEQAQIERARRLREKIDQLTHGTETTDSDGPKSLKEQIAERANQLNKEETEDK